MTVVRPAPKLRPLEPALGLRRLLGWYFYATQEQLAEKTRDLEYRERETERLRDEVAGLRAGGGTSSPIVKRVARIIHRAEQQLRAEHSWAAVDDGAVVAALVDAAATRAAARAVRDRIKSHTDAIERALDPLVFVRNDIERAIKLGVRDLDEALLTFAQEV